MPHAILFVNPDDSVVTTVFTHDDAALIARDIAELQRPGASGVQPGATMWHYADHGALQVALPTDRYFRSCWRWRGTRVTVDLPLARAQRLTELRRDRDVALAATDGPLLRDQEQGKDVSVLLARRQALRDMPTSAQTEMNAISSADGLRLYTPEVLK